MNLHFMQKPAVWHQEVHLTIAILMSKLSSEVSVDPVRTKIFLRMLWQLLTCVVAEIIILLLFFSQLYFNLGKIYQ